MKTAACLVLCLVAGGTVHLRAAEAAGLPVPTDAELAKIREAAPEKPTVAPRSPRRVLVFSLVPTGYVHSAIPYGEAALRIIAEKTGAFSVECSNNIAMFEPENLNRFDAVFFNNTNSALFLPGDSDTLSGAQKEAARKRDAELKQSLAAFIRNGKGIVALHAALAIFAEWEAWGDIIGGRFDNHPWNKEVTVRVEEPGHPLLQAFTEAEFRVHDEIYQVTGPYSRDTHRVLLSLDLEKTGAPNVAEVHRTDGDFALAWIKPYGDGRVFYCGLGHEHDLFWNPAILRFLLDGVQFAAGDLEADMTPSAKR